MDIKNYKIFYFSWSLKKGFFNILRHTLCTMRFNIHQLYVLPTSCICVFCTDFRIDSDYFPIHHSLIGFYTQTESVYCTVRAGTLSKTDTISSFRRPLKHTPRTLLNWIKEVAPPTRLFSYTFTHIITKIQEIHKDWLECNTKINSISLHKQINLLQNYVQIWCSNVSPTLSIAKIL
jgi:hypothetical protein